MTLIVSEPEIQYGIKSTVWADLKLLLFNFSKDGDSYQYEMEMTSNIVARKSGFSVQLLNKQKNQDFKDYLLSWPELKDEELRGLKEKRKNLNKWI